MASVPVLPPLDFNRLRSLESPKDGTIKALALELKKKMFTNGRYYYHLDDVKRLLNILSSQDKRGRHNAAPNPQNIPWGDCLLSALAIKDSMTKIGVRGSKEQDNAKKVVVASCTKLDANNNEVQNKKLLRKLLPHKSPTAKDKYLKKCIERREKFEETGDAEAFCHEVKEEERES